VTKKKDSDPFNFEQALEELEQLVTRLEEGDLSLEESLKEFERGVRLTRDCQTELREAEQKVRILTEQGEEKDFRQDDII